MLVQPHEPCAKFRSLSQKGCVMQNQKTNASLLLAALVATFALSACNTVEGVGKDVEAAGAEVSEEAHEANSDHK